MSPRRILAVALVLTFLLATSDAIRAAVITYAGADLTTNDAWRTNNLVKLLDIDGDNVYGTDGFVLFGGGQASSAPTYATVAQGAGTSVFGGNASYTNFDNAAFTGPAPVANVVSGVVFNAPGGTNPTDFVTFTLTQPQTFRLGVITDNADFAAISPTTLRVRQTVGGSADSGYVSAAADRDRDGDYYFFDVSGQAGDIFAVSGNNDSGFSSNGVYGVTFDSQIVPESSTLVLLATGLFGLAIWWRRRWS